MPRTLLHQKLRDELRRQIDSGELPPGAVLPGDHELRRLHGLSRTTVRLALDGLVREGRIVRARGRGTTVLHAEPAQLGPAEAAEAAAEGVVAQLCEAMRERRRGPWSQQLEELLVLVRAAVRKLGGIEGLNKLVDPSYRWDSWDDDDADDDDDDLARKAAL